MAKKSQGKDRAAKKKTGAFAGLRRGLGVLASCVTKGFCLVIGLGLISLLFVYLYGCLVKSPYFRLQEVTITGIEGEIKDEIMERCRLRRDVSLLSINLYDMKETIEKHPWIRRVDIEKRFPRTLLIRVERERGLALAAAGGLSYVNRWGEVFSAAGEMDNLDYPIITGLDSRESVKKKQLDEAVRILEVLEKHPAPWSLHELSEVHLEGNGCLSLYFTPLAFAIRVQGEELESRMKDLKRLVAHLKASGRVHGVRGINLDYRDAAVVQMKNG